MSSEGSQASQKLGAIVGVNVAAPGSAIKATESEASETPSLVIGVRGATVAAEEVEGSHTTTARSGENANKRLAKQPSAVLDPEEDPGDVSKEVHKNAEANAARYSFQTNAVRRFSKDLMANPENILQLPGTQELVSKIEKQLHELEVLPKDLFSELGSLLLSIIESRYYPLFLKTPFYKRFMQIKVLENLEQTPSYYEHLQVGHLRSHLRFVSGSA